MKKIVLILALLLMLTGCFDDASLELIDSEVNINEFSGSQLAITEEDGRKLSGSIVSLQYTFVLKNTGIRAIGDMDKYSFADQRYLNGISIKLIPEKSLKQAASEITGINFYAERERKAINLPLRRMVEPELVPNQIGDYTLEYVLGTSEVTPRLPAVSAESALEELRRYAMDATLVVYEGGQEVARFTLSE